MHKVYFRFHINKMHFGESVMKTFELPNGCIMPKRMTVKHKIAHLELDMEFVMFGWNRLLWNRRTSYVLPSDWVGVTSQLAHAWNRATIP